MAFDRGGPCPAANGPERQIVVEVDRKPLESDARENVNLILIKADRLFSGAMSQGRATYDSKEFLKVYVKPKEFSGAARTRLNPRDPGSLVRRRPGGPADTRQAACGSAS
jgi:hypothetical protein